MDTIKLLTRQGIYMKKSDVQFQIDQLRKDTIIYAIESCAISLIAIVILMGISAFVEGEMALLIVRFVIGLAVLYILYMGVGNLMRLTKIKQLEKQILTESLTT
jgi:hypothetical protein